MTNPPDNNVPPPGKSTQASTNGQSVRDENDASKPAQPRWLADNPWVTFVLPFAVYMLAGSLEPTAEKPFSMLGLTIEYSAYPLVYAFKIALTVTAMALVWPGYRQFPFRLSPLSLVVGVVGVVLWIALVKLRLEFDLLKPLGLGWLLDFGERAAFNPLANWPDEPGVAYGFLALRFFGLALVVPLIEEFFLRGFVMRFVVDAEWWKVPFGTLTPAAIAAGTLVPILLHPGEILAAAVWFSLVTWLMARTKNIWDCVAAHAVTNLLLGIYVVATGEWYFW